MVTDHDHSKCQLLLGELSAYLDGEAGEALCQEIERHIAECENCRIVVDTMARTVKLYREHGRTALPAKAKLRLYKTLDLTDYLPDKEQP